MAEKYCKIKKHIKKINEQRRNICVSDYHFILIFVEQKRIEMFNREIEYEHIKQKAIEEQACRELHEID